MDKNNGFTFIELLVVISIIILFAGLSLAYYNSFNEQTKLRTEARKLVDVLELTKKKAVASENAASCTTGFAGYRVDIGASNYFFSLCCTDGCQTNSPIQTYNFPSSNLSVYAGQGYIQFKQLTAIISTNIATNIIKIKNNLLSSSANCLNISFNNAGVFTIDDTFSSCP